METGVDNYNRLILRKPNSVFLGLGAIAASAIPMSFGAWLLWPYINYIIWGCRRTTAYGKCMEYWPRQAEPELWNFPVGFTCLIFTPIVCWVCCRYVRQQIREGNLNFGDLARFTLITSLKWQLIAAAIHLLIVFGFSGHGRMSWDYVKGAIMVVIIACIFHPVIAGFITLPLSLSSVTTFRLIALKRRR